MTNTTNTSSLTENLDEQLLKDLVITAVEGGINYWANIEDYDPDSGAVVVRDSSADSFDVDVDVIRSGIERVKTNPKLAPRFVAQVNQMLDGEDCDFDADTADVLVQVGLFGSVVYG